MAFKFTSRIATARRRGRRRAPQPRVPWRRPHGQTTAGIDRAPGRPSSPAERQRRQQEELAHHVVRPADDRAHRRAPATLTVRRPDPPRQVRASPSHALPRRRTSPGPGRSAGNRDDGGLHRGRPARRDPGPRNAAAMRDAASSLLPESIDDSLEVQAPAHRGHRRPAGDRREPARRPGPAVNSVESGRRLGNSGARRGYRGYARASDRPGPSRPTSGGNRGSRMAGRVLGEIARRHVRRGALPRGWRLRVGGDWKSPGSRVTASYQRLDVLDPRPSVRASFRDPRRHPSCITAARHPTTVGTVAVVPFRP